MVEEVGELELGDGLPEWELWESDVLEGAPGCPYIESGTKSHTNKEFSQPMGHEPEGGA